MKNKFTKSEKIYHNLSKNLNRISLRKNQKKHFFWKSSKMWTNIYPYMEIMDFF